MTILITCWATLHVVQPLSCYLDHNKTRVHKFTTWMQAICSDNLKYAGKIVSSSADNYFGPCSLITILCRSFPLVLNCKLLVFVKIVEARI